MAKRPNPFRELDVVRVEHDLPGLGLQVGNVGVVVVVYDEEHVEVEFEFEAIPPRRLLAVLHVIDLKRLSAQ